MSSTINRDRMKCRTFWIKKKKENDEYPKITEAWIKEFVGNKNILREKPTAWTSTPKIGMDKIRATTNAGKYFVDFASSSTIHGCNHLVAPHRHPIEKILAVIFIFGALVCFVLLSMNFWNRHQNEATINLVDNDYRNYNVTVPALLLCPMVKYDESTFPEVFERYGINDTEEARDFFIFLYEASYDNYSTTPIYDSVPPEKWLPILWEIKRDIIFEKCNLTVNGWVVTETGFCLSIEALFHQYMSYDYWMQNDWTRFPIPEDIQSYSYKNRETRRELVLNLNGTFVHAFYPLDIPNLQKSGVPLYFNQLIGIKVLVRETKSSPEVEMLPFRQRKCKKPMEGGLRLWPIYTQAMCLEECKYELMRKRCGCYPHFVRPMPGIPICTAMQLRCIGENRQEFLSLDQVVRSKCNCVPDCNVASYLCYRESISIISRQSASLFISINFPLVMVRREVLFSFNEFLTSVGGAAGLFLGASVISFVEIIYYATLRLFWYGVEMKKKKALRIMRIGAKRTNNKFAPLD